MPTYSDKDDLLTGNVPLPPYIDVNQFIQDAADEIDSHLGFIYKTPIQMDENGPVSRPARLLLKRISAHLSSGRLIMALDSSGQNEQLHNYGIYLVNEATSALRQIAEGKIRLDGAELPEDETTAAPNGPLISNLDSESQVEAFYDRIANPAYVPVSFRYPYGRP